MGLCTFFFPLIITIPFYLIFDIYTSAAKYNANRQNLKECVEILQPPPIESKDYAIGTAITVLAALLIFVGISGLGGGVLSGNQFNGQVVANGDGVTTVFDLEAIVCVDGKDVMFDAWLDDQTNEWEEYSEIAQFECGEGVIWISEGYNVTWDETNGDLQIIADEPPANGTTIVLDSDTFASIGSPVFLLSLISIGAGLTGWIVAAVMMGARKKQGILHGQLIGLLLCIVVIGLSEMFGSTCTDFYC